MAMRKTLFVAVVVLCLAVAAVPAHAQGLLPASFGAWSASSPAQPLSAADLEQSAGSDGLVLQEYKIEGGARGSYARGADSASITVYHLADPSAAYGLYHVRRQRGTVIGQQGFVPAHARAVPSHQHIPRPAAHREMIPSTYRPGPRPFPWISSKNVLY